MVGIKVLQSRLRCSLSPVCPFPRVICIDMLLQGESDKMYSRADTCGILEITPDSVISHITGVACMYGNIRIH